MMTKKKEIDNDKIAFSPIFATPLMQVQLDLDLEKLSEFAFQLQNKDKKGVQHSTMGGWQSNDIHEEKHEEFEKLKKEINQYLQIYHSEVFRGMKFNGGNLIQDLKNIWVNINEKHHYNEWHAHGFSTLSGVFYIKHDSSKENGCIVFKNPYGGYLEFCHWPKNIIKEFNQITSIKIEVTPKSNTLLIFPAWLEHKVGTNLKDDTRISVSFNSAPNLEKKYG